MTVKEEISVLDYIVSKIDSRLSDNSISLDERFTCENELERFLIRRKHLIDSEVTSA